MACFSTSSNLKAIMSQFTINELAEFSGVKPHTIRIWEQRFTFLTPQRTRNFRRVYTTEELNTFLDVILLMQSGFKISQVANMQTDEKIEIVSKLNRAQNTLKTINELIICMAEMNAERFELILNSTLLYMSPHEMIGKVIVPFCEKVGLFENHDNRSYLANLAIIREVIKLKIYSAIEKVAASKTKCKTVLLFLPVGGKHDLPLLYLNYFLQVKGFTCLYLGNDIDTGMLERVCLQKKPDIIVTHLFSKNANRELIEFVDILPEKHPDTSFISIGNPLNVKLNQSLYRSFNNLHESINYILLKS